MMAFVESTKDTLCARVCWEITSLSVGKGRKRP
jgi:hypothetical protein